MDNLAVFIKYTIKNRGISRSFTHYNQVKNTVFSNGIIFVPVFVTRVWTNLMYMCQDTELKE